MFFILILDRLLQLAQSVEAAQDLGHEIVKAEIVFRGDRDRLAEPQLVGAVIAAVRGAPFALVGGQNEGLSRAADQGCDAPVYGGEFGAGVDHKDDKVRFRDGLLGLLAHARRDAAGLGILQPRRVGEDDLMLADADARFLAVARQARHVVDKREPLACEAVEDGRFADIGPANDGDGIGHELPRRAMRDKLILRQALIEVKREPVQPWP